MNEKPEHVRLAESISDGIPVDWQNEAPGPTADDPMVRQLRDLERLAAAHRGGAEARAGSPTADAASGVISGAAMSAALQGSAEPSLESWGTLRILELLGQGEFGEVFRAYDPALQQHVALKLLLPGRHEERFLAEARSLARVKHPNVLMVHGTDRHDGRAGIWFELVQGQTLEQALARQGPFAAHEATAIGMELCRALAALHAAGLVHGDLKTANVMRETGGRVVLMDLGTARVSFHRPTPGDPPQGTPATMAPEQLRGEAVGPAADLYGLGVLLFRLVTGRYPIEASTLAELYDRHEQGAVQRVLDLRPELPPEFVRVVERALAPRPEARFQSAGEMESALAAILQTGPLPRPRPWGLWLWAALVPGIAILVVFLAWERSRGFWRFIPPRDITPVERSLPTVVAPALVPVARFHRQRDDRDELLAPNAAIAMGDALSLEIEASEPVHVYVLDRDEKGSVFVLFPLAGLDVSNPLPARTTLRLPGTRKRVPFAWLVSSRGGREEFTVLASRTPLAALEQAFDSLPRARMEPAADPARLGGPVAQTLRGVGILAPEPRLRASDSEHLSQALRALEQSRRDLWVWKIMLQGPEP